MSGQARSSYRLVNVQQQMVDHKGGTKEEEENKKAKQHNHALGSQHTLV